MSFIANNFMYQLVKFLDKTQFQLSFIRRLYQLAYDAIGNKTHLQSAPFYYYYYDQQTCINLHIYMTPTHIINTCTRTCIYNKHVYHVFAVIYKVYNTHVRETLFICKYARNVQMIFYIFMLSQSQPTLASTTFIKTL